MEMIIAAAIISAGVSIITAAFVTLLGCCSFRVYMEREIDHIGKEIIDLAKESIRNTHFNE